MRTEREHVRAVRKANIMKAFKPDETLFVNQVAQKHGLVWLTTNVILEELVSEKRLQGDKYIGYSLPSKKSNSILAKLKRLYRR